MGITPVESEMKEWFASGLQNDLLLRYLTAQFQLMHREATEEDGGWL
jgi:hypothetical protein